MGDQVRDAFAEYLFRLAPSKAELVAAAAHRSAVEQALRGEFPALVKVVPFGSHERGSALRGRSDIDLLAVLPRSAAFTREEPGRSDELVERVQAVLSARFRRTRVRSDRMAVVLEFEQGEEPVDVVPTFYAGPVETDGYPDWALPDGEGGWLRTHPEREAKFLFEQHASSGRKLFRLCRLLKAWKVTQPAAVDVSGFYLEMVAAVSKASRVGEGYARGLSRAFDALALRAGEPVPDPLELGLPVRSGPSFFGRLRLSSALSRAARTSREAVELEEQGNDRGALLRWQEIFCGELSLEGLERDHG